jgi:hypothetical protein
MWNARAPIAAFHYRGVSAASERFHSTLDFEPLPKHHFVTRAKPAVAGYIDRYKRSRRLSSFFLALTRTAGNSS